MGVLVKWLFEAVVNAAHHLPRKTHTCVSTRNSPWGFGNFIAPCRPSPPGGDIVHTAKFTRIPSVSDTCFSSLLPACGSTALCTHRNPAEVASLQIFPRIPVCLFDRVTHAMCREFTHQVLIAQISGRRYLLHKNNKRNEMKRRVCKRRNYNSNNYY